MSEYVNVGDTVEGAKCDVYTRKELFKGLRKDPITRSVMSVYELDRNCSVEVTEELPLSGEEAKKRESMGVHLSKGDKLKADAITLYVDSKRRLRFEVKEGQSGTHGGNLASTKSRTVGVIKYPFQCIQSKFTLGGSNSVKSILS